MPADIRRSPSGSEVVIAASDVSNDSDFAGASVADSLDELEALSDGSIVDEAWDFNGQVAVAGAMAVPGWAAFNSPTISQNGAVTPSANHPGQLNVTVNNTGANTGCVYYGPFDFSKVKSIKAQVYIPSSSGVSGTVIGFGLTADPTTMATVALGRLWPTSVPSVYAMVRSQGTGSGFWQIHTSGGTTPGTSLIPVNTNTWYSLEIRDVSSELGTGTWALYIDDVRVATRTLVPTSGIAYLAIGVVCNATPSGNTFIVDRLQIRAEPLDRKAA